MLLQPGGVVRRKELQVTERRRTTKVMARCCQAKRRRKRVKKKKKKALFIYVAENSNQKQHQHQTLTRSPPCGRTD